MAVKHTKWWREQMQPRIDMITEKGRQNDRAFLDTLGSAEQYTWHEGRKLADPEHVNPYNSADLRRIKG